MTSDSPGPSNAKTPTGAELPLVLADSAGSRGTVLGDDYPVRYRTMPWPYISNSIWDQWNFAYRQCTSFVAWRLNSANGVPFSNQYKGLTQWGDAGQWANSARSVGIRVDTTPEVGAVAWSGPGYGDASNFGHVAWVAQVLSSGNIVVEEYNFGWSGAYHARVVRPSEFQGYIHIKDMTASFTKSPKPTISGTRLVGSQLTANASGWSPAAKSYTYQWLRDGSPIAGATAKTYTPKLADHASRLSVKVSGWAPGYQTTGVTSAQTGPVLMTDADGTGIDDSQELMPWNSDVNGDGLPDAVAFGNDGVQVALNTRGGVGAPSRWVGGFGKNAGWSTEHHPRTMVDVNGDGKADVVGFASDGVYVALSTGAGFSQASRWTTGFGTLTDWWVGQHPRTIADVTGDGLPDVVGFANNGVYVAVNTGKGFATLSRWNTGFGVEDGWRVDRHPRLLADMNNDGRDDIVGFGNNGVSVALSTGKGFAAPKSWTAGFGYGSGWSTASHPRTLADINGDGRLDAVGFASNGVYVAINSGSSLGTTKHWLSDFGTAHGWSTGSTPRQVADVNGDGKADIVGFSETGVRVALSTGTSLKAATTWSKEFGQKSSTVWRVDRHPRSVTDVNGDGRADIVGFGDTGLRVATSTGSKFGASSLWQSALGYNAGGWRVESHPRTMTAQTLVQSPVPSVAGTAKVGEKLSATIGAWRPAPVTLSAQWYRDGARIAGATSKTYTLQPADADKTITYRVKGTKLGFAPVQRPSTALKVEKGTLTAHTPAINGTLKAGSTVKAEVAAWGPSLVPLSYQWLRNGSPIAGATSSSYKLTSVDKGRRISVTVTGSLPGYNTATRTSATVKPKGTAVEVPKTSPFVDVKPSHRFYKHITWMEATGVAAGTKTAKGVVYGPENSVNRGAMAAFMYRLAADKSYQAPTKVPFVDVPKNHTFFGPISWMSKTGLAVGSQSKAGTVYSPSAPVNRGAMAAFIYRLEAPKGYKAPDESPFVDVPTTHKFYTPIAWMYEQGIAAGTQTKQGLKYSPESPVNRGAMAAFLYRLETGG